jgi:hypothetical protein
MSSESRSNPGCFYIGYFCWIDSASRTKITYICWTELEQLALWNIEREDWRLGQSLTLSYSCLALGILGGRLAALAIGHLEALFGSKKLQGKCKCVLMSSTKSTKSVFWIHLFADGQINSRPSQIFQEVEVVGLVFHG